MARSRTAAARAVPPPLYTIGHSTRSYDELVAALRAWQVATVVDIRHVARSRTNPQFDGDRLADQLASDDLGYVAMPDLGGRRPRSTTVAIARNAGWQQVPFKNYADYAETPEFRAALDRLLALAAATTCAVMCAEAVWWRCHRRIVADYALARGRRVLHIFTASKADLATPTPFARVDRRRGTVRYPAT